MYFMVALLSVDQHKRIKDHNVEEYLKKVVYKFRHHHKM